MSGKAKRGGAKKSGRTWRIVLAIIVAVAIIGTAVGLGIYYRDPIRDFFTGIAAEKPGAVTVTMNGKEYDPESGALTVQSGFVLGVKSDKTAEIKIVGRRLDPEVEFEADGQPYRWSEFEGVDMTDGFEIKKNGNQYTLVFGTAREIFQKARGFKETTFPEKPDGCAFLLVVSAGDKKVEIPIGLSYKDLEVEPDHVIV